MLVWNFCCSFIFQQTSKVLLNTSAEILGSQNSRGRKIVVKSAWWYRDFYYHSSDNLLRAVFQSLKYVVLKYEVW